MSRVTIVIFGLFFSCLTLAQINPNHVKGEGYIKADGTKVNSYMRTAPNSTVNDNFSTIGNTNPYTGKPGWIARDNYAYSYRSSSSNKSRRVVQKTEPIKSYGRQDFWVYNKLSKLNKKSIKKDDFCMIFHLFFH